MIGGSDKVLWAPKNAKAADVILRVVGEHWPNYVFQNAEDENPVEPSQPSALPVPTGHEFFLYRDMKAAKSWLKSGATARNKNTLIYVILGTKVRPARGLRSITLVASEWTGILAEIASEIETVFAATKKQSHSQAAPLHVTAHTGDHG